jgi:hypothetical protein
MSMKTPGSINVTIGKGRVERHWNDNTDPKESSHLGY